MYFIINHLQSLFHKIYLCIFTNHLRNTFHVPRCVYNQELLDIMIIYFVILIRPAVILRKKKSTYAYWNDVVTRMLRHTTTYICVENYTCCLSLTLPRISCNYLVKGDRILRNVSHVVCFDFPYSFYPENLNPRIIIIIINRNWVVTRWQWLFYMYTDMEK